MLFNSIDFLIFFTIVFLAYCIFNNSLKIQNYLLLFASYIFYGWWDWRFLVLIIFASTFGYFSGYYIYNSNSERKRKTWLLLSVFSNLGLLSLFKYYNFFAESFASFMILFGWQPNNLTLNIILPVGISFYTFQILSYTIDIYRKDFKPTAVFVNFLTYIAFFPQLVAGPIERASNLLPQIEKRRSLSIELFNAGLIQILIGLFRKIVIADGLGAYVDIIYGDIELYNSTTIFFATFLYAFQIYYDFAGYSDIAIGTAKLLGFKFNQNFNLPYFSNSLTDFWRKWHISLSFWLRDYLYISLGGNRFGIQRTYRNLIITMLLGGLWHGSSWNFVIWGGIHGLGLSFEKYLKSVKFISGAIVRKYFGYPITFVIVLFSWIFFRSENLDKAIIALKRIFEFDFSYPFIGDINVLTNSLIVLIIGISFDFYLYLKRIHLEEFGEKFSILKISFLASAIILLLSLFYSSSNNFIYFQF